MTPAEQRIAICRACKWKEPLPPSTLCGWTDTDGIAMLSDPLFDLNAMHEAEKTLNDEQHDYFSKWLIGYPKNSFRPISATAPQRAEAFLRTIGKWRDA